MLRKNGKGRIMVDVSMRASDFANEELLGCAF